MVSMLFFCTMLQSCLLPWPPAGCCFCCSASHLVHPYLTHDGTVLTTCTSPVSLVAPLEFMILDLSPCSHIDATGSISIGTELGKHLARQGIQVVLAGPNGKVLRSLERSKSIRYIGKEWVFGCVADAVDACKSSQKIRIENGDVAVGNGAHNGTGASSSSSVSSGSAKIKAVPYEGRPSDASTSSTCGQIEIAEYGDDLPAAGGKDQKVRKPQGWRFIV